MIERYKLHGIEKVDRELGNVLVTNEINQENIQNSLFSKHGLVVECAVMGCGDSH